MPFLRVESLAPAIRTPFPRFKKAIGRLPSKSAINSEREVHSNPIAREMTIVLNVARNRFAIPVPRRFALYVESLS